MGETIYNILFLSLLAGMATVIGVFIVFYFGIPNRQTMAVYLGLAAGVMITVSIDLIIHSMKIGNLRMVACGLFLGVVLMAGIARLIVWIHEKYRNRHRVTDVSFSRIGWTMVFGIAAHNIPEGFAIAAGEAANHSLGITLLIAIALHNIPEGIGVTAPLLKSRTSKSTIIIALIAVALCVPLGTAFGLYIVHITTEWISIALSFAAGAMTYIVFVELVPSAWRQQPLYAQFGIFIGVMALLISQLL